MFKEISKLILLQVQHNIDAGKSEGVTVDEINDIISKEVSSKQNIIPFNYNEVLAGSPCIDPSGDTWTWIHTRPDNNALALVNNTHFIEYFGVDGTNMNRYLSMKPIPSGTLPVYLCNKDLEMTLSGEITKVFTKGNYYQQISGQRETVLDDEGISHVLAEWSVHFTKQ